MPKRIILVQALYDYHGPNPGNSRKNLSEIKQSDSNPQNDSQIVSSDNSNEAEQEEFSLTFKQGDYIQVLTRLPSGWWDGICNGKRGWFPSNFVSSPTIVTDREYPAMTTIQTEMNSSANPGTIRAHYTPSPSSSHVHNFDHSTNEVGTISPTVHNPVTGRPESALFSPISSNGSEDGNSNSRILLSGIRNLSISSHRDSIGLIRLDSQRKRERESSQSSNFRVTSPTDSVHSDLSYKIELPPNWGVKSTYLGRTYYYNMLTNETRWNLEGIDPVTGEDTNANMVQSERDLSKKAIPPAHLLQQAVEWTWDGLFARVKTIKSVLETFVRDGCKEQYVPVSSMIVESIRFMLHASGTSSTARNSHMKQPEQARHKQLKTHHRNILSTLSKLILAAKMASAIWPAPDASDILVQIADEVLKAVGLFMIAAQEIGIAIRPIHPLSSSSRSMTEPSSEELSNAGLGMTEGDSDTMIDAGPSNASFISELEASMKKVMGLIEQLDTPDVAISDEQAVLDATMHPSDSQSSTSPNPVIQLPQYTLTAATLISRVRAIVSEVGSFLSIVDDAPLESLSDDLTVDFKVNRLSLYNAISGLVMSIQTATSNLAPPNAVEQIFVSTSMVEKAVKEVLICTKFLVEEKETMEQLTLQTYIEQYGTQVRSTPIESQIQSSFSSSSSFADQSGQEIPSTQFARHRTIPASEQMVATKDTSSHDNLTHSFPSHEESSIDLIPVSQNPALTDYTNSMPSKSTDHESGSIPQSGAPRSSSDSSDGKLLNQKLSQLSKIQKILGSEVTAQPLPDRAKDELWFLRHDSSEGELLYSMEGTIRAGTLRALIERLTPHDSFDANFTLRFLLCYRSFASSSQVLEHLKARFFIEPPKQLDSQQLEMWLEKKQTPIRIRVFNVLKSWTEHYLQTDQEDQQVLVDIKEFAEAAKTCNMSFAATQLIRIVDRRLGLESSSSKITVAVPRQCPPPILPRSSTRSFRLVDIDPLEIARQFTLMESTIFSSIQPLEFLGKAWSQRDDPSKSLNVKRMISTSNQITSWVAHSILQEKEPRRRAKMISFFISVADKCSSLNNFNSLMAILASLNSAPIHRLKRTWDLVNSRAMSVLTNLRKIMSSTKNFMNYRQMLHSLNPPCVPFLGFYLTDLTFLEDGNPTYVSAAILQKSPSKRYLQFPTGHESSEHLIPSHSMKFDPPHGHDHSNPFSGILINFAKMAKMADVIREVQQFQHVPYALTPVSEIQDALWSSLKQSPEENVLYDMSLALEPKDNNANEYSRLKILLTDSGLL